MKNKPTLGLLLCIVIAFPVLGQLQPVYTFLKDDSLLKRNYYDQTILKKKAIINSLLTFRYASGNNETTHDKG